MSNEKKIIKCTRCRHKHHFSDRIEKPNYKEGWNDVVCPKCGGKVYTTVTPKPTELLNPQIKKANDNR